MRLITYQKNLSTTVKKLFFLIFLIQFQFGFSQELKTRSLEELINKENSGFRLVEEWIKEAKNKIEILEKDPLKADSALYRTQVTTKSTMGAIVYETGGILVDNGWLRILGSGSDKMKRNLPEWNKGKSFEDYGQVPSFLLIADDAIGGFFALNGGGFGNIDFGKIYYFSPDNLEWEPLGMGYTDFINWAFTGDLKLFYKDLRWKSWKKEIKEMGPDRAMNFYPYLFTQYDDLEKLSRKDVPIEEMWRMQMDLRKELMNSDKE